MIHDIKTFKLKTNAETIANRVYRNQLVTDVAGLD